LKPVTVVSSNDQPVYHSRPATRHEQDVEGDGCCHFSNNFYLTAAFGFVFSVICVFQTFFFLVFGYILPTCACSGFWAHLLALSTNVKLVYFTVLLYLLAFTVFGFICLRGLLLEKKRKIIPFLVILIITQITIIIGAIVGAVKGGEAYENMQNQNKDDIFDMLRMVMKEKYVKFVSSAMDLAEATLNEDAINFKAVTEEVFHPEVLVQADAVKQMMIFTSAMVGLGMNLLIIFSIVLLFKVVQRMNTFERFMQEQPRVFTSPQYLQPVEQKDYQYIPNHQSYFNQPAPANGTLSKRSQKSRQSEENLLVNPSGQLDHDDYHASG